LQAPAADQHLSCPILTLGRPMHSLQWGFKLLQERRMKAELLQSQVQTPRARCACLQQAAILQQQQQQKLPEAPREGGEAQYLPQKCKFRKYSQFFKDLANAECSQTNYSNCFGTSQKGLAILKRKTVDIYLFIACVCPVQ